ncbi:MAG: nuclear transport factor 2 family protein [Syntrophobacteraceae bacterium]
MVLKREEIINTMVDWEKHWNEHDIDGVMDLFHEEVVFENWMGGRVQGKQNLYQAWAPWFKNHGGFRFNAEDLFADEKAQKVLYRWRLDWPSSEKGFEGKPEKRRGVDVITFQDGKIIHKMTYSKTAVEIDGARVRLSPAEGDK